ncbi:type II secretion system protein [Uliginosibacterium sp. 31-16]|uniref:PulJ/GspJ family protein n=1 Tax=Uliginosibacterium sp. 31-16 TaxID=3068315 RepID=UPI00273D2137|nr:type II secretion system protein [Uliginosibacterium sp. 31-16]MDP5240237.1 type II secretion system protein [Uliginosibacterium sp. 31-16]
MRPMYPERCLKSRTPPASSGCRLERPARRGSAGGFTLIEMVVVMTITGILVAIVAVFIQRPMQGLVDSTRRAALTDAADTAVRRMSRDIQRALPNSVRVVQSKASWYIEFLPVLAAGRYCEAADCGAAPLTAGVPLNSFSFANPAPVLNPVPANAEVAIYNLGSDPLNAYAGGNSVALASIAGNLITLGGSKAFPFSSPGKRFFIIGSPVSYVCTSGGTLTRVSGYVKQATQPTTALPAGSLLSGNVASCAVNYQQSAIDQYGLLYLSLQLSQNGENVTLTHAIQINNTP